MSNKENYLYLVSALAALVVIIDLTGIEVTFVTFSFFIIALLPLLLPYLKEIHFPGGSKIVLNRLKRLHESAEQSGFAEEAVAEPAAPHPYEFVVEHDPIIALAGLRIEIERRLKQLTIMTSDSPSDVQGPGLSLHKMINRLEHEDVLPTSEAGIMRELLPILNQAVHDGDVARQARDDAIDIGGRLLASLDRIIRTLEADQAN